MKQSQIPVPIYFFLLKVGVSTHIYETLFVNYMHLILTKCSSAGSGFGSSHARNLLSPEKVKTLIQLPTGCLEQTMTTLAPTALALRYLDLSDQWFDLPPGARDEAFDHIEAGMFNMFEEKHSLCIFRRI